MLSEMEQKAGTLIAALPYIQKFYKKTVVIKYGGNAMVSEKLKDAVISDVVLLSLVGINVVLVHGGGPEISDMLKKVGKESRLKMVLAGKVNKELVSRLSKKRGKAIGLCGLDGSLIKARKLEASEDLGFVGEVTDVNPDVILNAFSDGYIPVVATVAEGEDGETYNINADTAAAKIAAAVGAVKLILLTDIQGVMRDPSDEKSLIPVIRTDEVKGLEESGVIKGGMIPKIECCVDAIESGVRRAHIIDGRIPHSILIELLSDEGIGTMIH